MLFFSLMTLLLGCSVHSLFTSFPMKKDFFFMTRYQGLIVSQSFLISKEKKIPLIIYIEGDGMAYDDEGFPNEDPTPIPTPTGFSLRELAEEHMNQANEFMAADIVYLGRPCQWIPKSYKENYCVDRKIWTADRFSEDVLHDYETLIEGVLEKVQWKKKKQPIEMVAYSGGAFVAFFIADGLMEKGVTIHHITTLSGNLFPNDTQEFHGLKPLTLAPLPMIKSTMKRKKDLLYTITHIVGQDDHVIPWQKWKNSQKSQKNQKKHSFLFNVIEHRHHAGPWGLQDIWPLSQRK